MKHPLTKGERGLVMRKAKSKAKAKAVVISATLTQRQIGILAKQHSTCGCGMCTCKQFDVDRFKGLVYADGRFSAVNSGQDS